MSKESIRIKEIMKELSELSMEMASLFHSGTPPEEINKLVLRGAELREEWKRLSKKLYDEECEKYDGYGNLKKVD
jgi:hypothetical protein